MVIAVFLDRDGTLNEERGYLRELESLELIPGAAQAVRRLNDAGILAILTTNQSGPARGYYDEAHVQALNSCLCGLLKETAGAKLDAVFYSACLSDATVESYRYDDPSRKPGIGMIESACKQFPEIDIKKSYTIGDKATDVTFGINAGCKTILLKTGYGQAVLDGTYQMLEHSPNHICNSIVDAVDIILKENQQAYTLGSKEEVA